MPNSYSSICFPFLPSLAGQHMQEHVRRALGPSSKHTANRTDRKYVLRSQTVAAESVPGLFQSVSTHFKGENSHSASEFPPTQTLGGQGLLFMSQTSPE